MATKLERFYHLPEGKSIDGMAKSIENYFEKFDGMDVSVDKKNSGTILITCKTKPLIKSIHGITKRVSGHDLDIVVGLYQQDGKVQVEFEQKINEGKRLFTAIFTSFVGIGLGKIHGIVERHNIPYELNDTINLYLH